MCGVIGVYLEDVNDDDIKLVKNMILQSMIRGKHATGISYISSGALKTIKEPIPADQFLEKYPIYLMIDNYSLKMIAHTRYSTSDLRYNQPFQGERIAIAHNGVISQDPDIWEYETDTLNDSELVLRCIESGDHPLEVYKDRSMAVVSLQSDGVHAYRNHERPLWTAQRDNGQLFASTKDILYRSGVKSVQRCEPMVHYTYSRNGLKKKQFDNDQQDLQP